MKVRVPIARTAFRARMTALCWGALIVLAPMAVSACSGSSSSPTVPTFSPSVNTSTPVPASFGNTPASGGTSSPGTSGVNTSAPAPGTATATATATITVAPAVSKVPSAAPVTGGGGTAGLQDGLLFGLGAAAILAGAGSIVYRRRLTRNR